MLEPYRAVKAQEVSSPIVVGDWNKPVTRAEMPMAKGTSQTNLQISQTKENINSLKYGWRTAG